MTDKDELGASFGEYKDNVMYIYNDLFSVQTKDMQTEIISHEIGHAVDDVYSFSSDKKEYNETFEGFQSLVIPLLRDNLVVEEFDDVYA